MVETLGGVPAHAELAEGVCRSGPFEEYEENISRITDPQTLLEVVNGMGERSYLSVLKNPVCDVNCFNAMLTTHPSYKEWSWDFAYTLVKHPNFKPELLGRFYMQPDQLLVEIVSQSSNRKDIIASIEDGKLLLAIIKECNKRDRDILEWGFFDNCYLNKECFVELSHSCVSSAEVIKLVSHSKMDSPTFFAIVENQTHDLGFLYQFFEWWLERSNVTLEELLMICRYADENSPKRVRLALVKSLNRVTNQP